MYFRVNLKMKKPNLYYCFTWIVFLELNFTVAFLLIRKTWDDIFADKVKGWKSKESIKWLPITNPGFTGLKPLGVFMARLIKRVPDTLRASVVNSELSPWNDCTRLIDMNWIHRKLSQSSFLKKIVPLLCCPKIWYLYSVHSFWLLFFLEVTKKASSRDFS